MEKNREGERREIIKGKQEKTCERMVSEERERPRARRQKKS